MYVEKLEGPASPLPPPWFLLTHTYIYMYICIPIYIQAKGMNMYGEKLEGPAAQFRRDKIANQAKYDSMMLKEREMSKKV